MSLEGSPEFRVSIVKVIEDCILDLKNTIRWFLLREKAVFRETGFFCLLGSHFIDFGKR
jgi:hypothetical protein